MKIKNWFKDSQNQIIAAVFIITMVIACAPLVSRYCINGHDLEYHLLRIESLKEGIKMGRPFLKVNVLFFGEAGYASSMFYPDFLLYIPALLRVIGVSINASYHIFVAMCIILAYISTYLCVKNMTGLRACGMISAVTLTLCQYHLDDIYVRSAVGEYTAFIFIPVIVYAIYNVVCEDMDKPQLFVLGYSGIILCHTASFVMCVLFGLIVFLISFKKVFLNKKVFLKLIDCVLFTLALTCFYWLPMFEQFMYTSFYVSTPWVQPKDEALDFVRIFRDTFPSLGPVCILLLIPRIFIKDKKGEGREKYRDILIWAGMAFTLFACNILPWDRLGKYASFIQFPWRFFIMASVMFSMAAGILFLSFTDDDLTLKSRGTSVLILVLLINGICGFGTINRGLQGYYDYSDDYYSYKPYTANVIAGEWLPEAVKDKDSLVEDSGHMTLSDGTGIPFTRIKNTIVADIKADAEYVDVPFVYYKGYRAEYTGTDGKKALLWIRGEGKNGLCRVYLSGQGNGRLKVYYRGTVTTWISVFISVTGILLMIFVYYRYKRDKGTGNNKIR